MNRIPNTTFLTDPQGAKACRLSGRWGAITLRSKRPRQLRIFQDCSCLHLASVNLHCFACSVLLEAHAVRVIATMSSSNIRLSSHSPSTYSISGLISTHLPSAHSSSSSSSLIPSHLPPKYQTLPRNKQHHGFAYPPHLSPWSRGILQSSQWKIKKTQGF